MTELKNCPFCGGEAKISTPPIILGDDDGDVDWLQVTCQHCGVSRGFTRFRDHNRQSADFLRAKAEAIAAWNQRDTSELERGIRLGIEAAARLISAAANNCRLDVVVERYGDEATDYASVILESQAAAILALDPAAIVKEKELG